MNPHLSIGTTTDRINLLDENGILLKEWTPVEGGHDSTYVESSMGDYGQVISYRETDVDERLTLVIKRTDQDTVIRMGQDLRRMLRTALNYWTDSWRTDFVYLKARAAGETNTRYAIIKDGEIPKDNNPFALPFASCDPIMDDFELSITRGPWLDNVPGTGTAAEIAGYDTYCTPYYLEFDGVDDYVNAGDDAKLQNLPDNGVAGKGQITIETWVRVDTFANSYFAGKSGFSNIGFNFGINAATGLAATINCVTQPAIATSGLDEFSDDGLWHHVLMTYDETGAGTPAARTIYLAVDGTWVASYPTQQVSIGNYIQDDGYDLSLGIQIEGATSLDLAFDGDIGWIQIHSVVAHDPAGGNFTPTVRCGLPDVDAAGVEGIWIYEGAGGTTGNLDGGTAGTIVGYDEGAGAQWVCDCDPTYGNVEEDGDPEPTTSDEVYFANKFNSACLTHIYISDGGVFGSNLITDPFPAAPIDLFPAVIANNDAIYFGVETVDVVDYGPFCSLVFDIGTAIQDTNIDDIEWEYSDGGAGWPSLTVQDNTNQNGLETGIAFTTTGACSVHWEQPTDWAVEAVNTVTGFWVRARINDAGAFGDPPTQQNRNIYTVTWPYIEIESDVVEGDLFSQAKLRLREQSNLDGITRIVGGLRSTSRGASFRSYLNYSEQQNGAGILCEVFNQGAFAADPTFPTGRKVDIDAPANAWTEQARHTIYFNTAIQYRGTFRAFLRIDQVDGDAGDVKLKIKSFFAGKATATYDSGELVPTSTDAFHVIDVGRVQFIPPDTYDSDDRFTLEIKTYVHGGTDTDDIDLIDLILIPVDEWAFDIRGPGTDEIWGMDRDEIWLGDCVVLDGIEYPRRALRSIQIGNTPEDVFMSLLASANAATGFPPRKEARIHFFAIDDTGEVAIHELAGTAQAWSMAQYLSMRGAR